MDAIKRINFLRDHPDGQFPQYDSLPQASARALRDRIGARIGLQPIDDALVFAHTLAARQRRVPGVGANAEDLSFDLLEILSRLSIAPADAVYVNWDDFDHVDRLKMRDLARYFSYLWYPGPDAIDIFDESCAWVVSIDPDGEVTYVFNELG